MSDKPEAGQRLPEITVAQLGGGELHHLAGLAKGLKFIRDNEYSIRGRLAA